MHLCFDSCLGIQERFLQSGYSNGISNFSHFCNICLCLEIQSLIEIHRWVLQRRSVSECARIRRVVSRLRKSVNDSSFMKNRFNDRMKSKMKINRFEIIMANMVISWDDCLSPANWINGPENRFCRQRIFILLDTDHLHEQITEKKVNSNLLNSWVSIYLSSIFDYPHRTILPTRGVFFFFFPEIFQPFIEWTHGTLLNFIWTKAHNTVLLWGYYEVTITITLLCVNVKINIF